MYYTVHAPTGILISQQTNNLWLIFLLAIIFHFILDIIPHGDIKIEEWCNKKNPKKRFLKILIIDGIISLSLVSILYLKIQPQSPWPFLTGIFGSALPDLFWIPLKFKNIKFLEKYRKIHSKIHQLLKPKMPVWLGLTLQTFISIFIIYLILNP